MLPATKRRIENDLSYPPPVALSMATSPAARKGRLMRNAGLLDGAQSQRRKSGRRPAGGAALATNAVAVEHGISASSAAGSFFEGGEAALKPPAIFSIGLAAWPACAGAFIT